MRSLFRASAALALALAALQISAQTPPNPGDPPPRDVPRIDDPSIPLPADRPPAGTPPPDKPATPLRDKSIRTIELKSGDLMVGRVIEMRDMEVLIELADLPGSRAGIKKTAIDPADLFDLERERIKDTDPEAWVRLAGIARDAQLYRRQVQALRRAAELDPNNSEKYRQEIRGVAEARLLAARTMMETEDYDGSIRLLRRIEFEFEGTPSADDAERMTVAVRELQAKDREEEALVLAQARLVVRERREIDAASRMLVRGFDRLKAGRQVMERPGQADKHFEGALRDFNGGLRLLRGFSLDAALGLELQENLRTEAGRTKADLVSGKTQAHLELGYVALIRGNFNTANRHAGEAQAIAPDSEGVRSLRNAIGIAQAGGERSRFGRFTDGFTPPPVFTSPPK